MATKKRKGRAARPYTYRARVVRSKKMFTLETLRPLEFGANVKHEGKAYRVTYVYKDGTQDAVVILTPVIVRRAPRKVKKRRK